MEQTLAHSNSPNQNNGQILNNMAGDFQNDPQTDGQEAPEVQHKLHSSWTIWYMNGDTRTAPTMGWDQMLQPLATFDTIEKFWNIYHRLCPPSKMKVKNDYMLFREGIKPQWEDVSNKAGGSWKMVLPSKHRGALLDRIWLETVFSLIGEHYEEDGSYVNGAYLQRRQKEDRVAIWTGIANSTDHKEPLMNIGHKFKESVKVTNDTKISFSSHEDNYSDNSKSRNSSWKYRQPVKYQV